MRIYDQDIEPSLLNKLTDELYLAGESDMSWSRGGNFTRNLLSLQLQLQTLLEGVGGEGTASLLDGLAQLSESERKRIIPLLSRVVGKVLKGEKRLSSAEDQELQNFEDSLFDSIMAALGQSANDDRVTPESERKLEIVPGGRKELGASLRGKPVKVPSLIDLAKARESRRQRFDTPPNEVS
ncbi:MAG: hypothetical protein ACK5GN_02355 [Pseudomonadota bacterium]